RQQCDEAQTEWQPQFFTEGQLAHDDISHCVEALAGIVVPGRWHLAWRAGYIALRERVVARSR
ncbi:hypothetical protein ABTE52_21620, partial [Acinetobacter baumannii]